MSSHVLGFLVAVSLIVFFALVLDFLIRLGRELDQDRDEFLSEFNCSDEDSPF